MRIISSCFGIVEAFHAAVASTAKPPGLRYLHAMRMIHLSDIHFREGHSGTNLDPDAALRHALMSDAESRCVDNKATAILVGGDIAYGGKATEHAMAEQWLNELRMRAGTDDTQIFVVPGNHDVDRSIADRPIRLSIHNAIRDAQPMVRAALSGHLKDAESADTLFKPLQSYNAFAAKFLCDLKWPERTVAALDLTLNDGSTLALRGLNTVAISNSGDAEGNMLVDEACFNLLARPGQEYLTLAHHPPRWLAEGNALETHLNSVSKIQLFGHEHDARVHPARDYVRVFAGAVCPERDKQMWRPGYNLIDVSIQSDGSARTMIVDIVALAWQQSPPRFVEMTDTSGEGVFRMQFKLPSWMPPGGGVLPPSRADTESVDSGGSMSINQRKLFMAFLQLSLSKRSEIAGRLELLEDADSLLPDNEKFRLVLIRARDRSKLDALEKAVEEMKRT